LSCEDFEQYFGCKGVGIGGVITQKISAEFEKGASGFKDSESNAKGDTGFLNLGWIKIDRAKSATIKDKGVLVEQKLWCRQHSKLYGG
jgi:hypothetical protein